MIDWWEKLYGGMNTYCIILSFLSPISTLAFLLHFLFSEINVAVKTQRLPSSATCWQPPVLQTCSDCSNPGQDRDQQVICPGRRKVNVELLSTRNFESIGPQKRDTSYVFMMRQWGKDLIVKDLGKVSTPKIERLWDVFWKSSLWESRSSTYAGACTSSKCTTSTSYESTNAWFEDWKLQRSVCTVARRSICIEPAWVANGTWDEFEKFTACWSIGCSSPGTKSLGTKTESWLLAFWHVGKTTWGKRCLASSVTSTANVSATRDI